MSLFCCGVCRSDDSRTVEAELLNRDDKETPVPAPRDNFATPGQDLVSSNVSMQKLLFPIEATNFFARNLVTNASLDIFMVLITPRLSILAFAQLMISTLLRIIPPLTE